MHLRPSTPKQSSPLILQHNQKFSHLRSHLRNRSSTLLQKKPQILMMKWNNFIEQYHFWKQINTVNSSLFACNAVLKKKKQQNFVIKNVDYIVSEQVSVEEKLEDVLNSRQSHLYCESEMEKSRNVEKQAQNLININQQSIVKSRVGNYGQEKIVISVKINEDQHSEKSSIQQENFTDEQDSSTVSQFHKVNVESTNKNSKINQSFEEILETEAQPQIENVQQEYVVPEHLHKTAFFSFSEQYQKQPNSSYTQTSNKQRQVQKKKSTKDRENNQQNYNHLNKQIKSRKVEVLLKMNKQRQIRRQRAQQILKEDREFLSKIIGKK